jgi:hypothetical protein
MRGMYVDDDYEMSSEVQQVQISESQPGGASNDEKKETGVDKKRVSKKLSERIKGRIKNYIRNLDPRGKDKFWWSGTILSTAASAALLVTSPASLPFKTLVSATASIGLYAVEKGMEKYHKMRLSEEEFAEKVAKKQEKFPNGTSRLRRFLLGVSAGGIYGAALGIPLEATGAINYHPVKNVGRRIDALKRDI